MDLSTQAGQEILADIERNTSSSRGWRNLMLLCFDQKDIDTFKTLQIICEGLDKLFEMKKLEAKREFEAAVKAIRESKIKIGERRLPNPIVTVVPLMDSERLTFVKLARTPNNSALLEKVAIYYLDNWGLPDVAQKHLERALNFEPDDKHVNDTLAKAVEALSRAVPAIQAVAATTVDAPSPEGVRESFSQTMRLKLPGMLRRASGPLPSEPSQMLLKHHIEHINDKPVSRRKDPGFRTANLGTLHQQLKTLQSKIDIIEQRAQGGARPPQASIETTPLNRLRAPLHSQKPPGAPVEKKAEEIPDKTPQSAPEPKTEQAEPVAPPPAAPVPEVVLSPAELLSRSLANVQEGNLDAAADDCRRAIELDSDQPLVWHTWATIGLGYFEKHQLDKAINSFNEALRLEPNAVESWFNMGVAYSEKGDLEGALRCYLRSLFLSPESPKVRCNLGAVYFQNSQFEHAEQCFRKALEFQPDYARAWDNLGATLSAMDKLPEAAEACRKAVELKPDYSEAWFKLGTILFQQEKDVEARAAFEQSASLREDFPASFVYLALLHARGGRLEEAEASCKKFTILGGLPGLDWLAWHEFALACLQKERTPQAVAAARRAMELQPSEPEPWFTLGMTQQHAGNFDEAELAYTHCLKLRPDMPFAWYNLGLIRWEQKKFIQACDALQHAILSDPASSSAWLYLGRAREAVRQIEPALEAYRKAIERDPKSVDAWQCLSSLLEESGRHAEAEEAKQKALAALQG